MPILNHSLIVGIQPDCRLLHRFPYGVLKISHLTPSFSGLEEHSFGLDEDPITSCSVKIKQEKDTAAALTRHKNTHEL
jgi:hypothetical protein